VGILLLIGRLLLNCMLRSITSARHVGIFRAACALYKKRLRDNNQLPRACVSKHQVPRSSVIYCRPCHNGRCMTHILESFHTHSASAILVSEEGSPPNWHEFHQESKAGFKESRASILRDEEAGVRPDFCLRLACVASKFRACKSVNPNATIPGWYDRCIELPSASVSGSPSSLFLQNS